MPKSNKQLMILIDSVLEAHRKDAMDNSDEVLDEKLSFIQRSLHEELLGACCVRGHERSKRLLELSDGLHRISAKAAYLSSGMEEVLGACCERGDERNKLMLELSDGLQSISAKAAYLGSRSEGALNTP